MSVNSNALCSLEEVIEHGALSDASADDNDLIEGIINNVTSLFHIIAGLTQFKSQTYTNKRYDGSGDEYLFLHEKNITSIASIYDDDDWAFGSDTLIDSSDYTIVDNSYIVLKDGIFTKGKQNIKITFTAGYAANSNELLALKEACIIEVTRAFNRRGKEDVSGQTDQYGNVTYTEKDLLIQTRMLLKKLSNHGIY